MVLVHQPAEGGPVRQQQGLFASARNLGDAVIALYHCGLALQPPLADGLVYGARRMLDASKAQHKGQFCDKATQRLDRGEELGFCLAVELLAAKVHIVQAAKGAHIGVLVTTNHFQIVQLHIAGLLGDMVGIPVFTLPDQESIEQGHHQGRGPGQPAAHRDLAFVGYVAVQLG